MAGFTTISDLDVVKYDEAIKDLAGSPQRAILPALFTMDNTEGKSASYQNIEPYDDDTYSAASGLTHFRADYDNGATGLWANYEPLLTPHKDVQHQRTHCYPYMNDWGYHFRDVDDLRRGGINMHNDTIRQGMRKIWVREDRLCISTLAASTMARGETGTSSVSFPAAQVVTESDGILDKDTILRVARLYEQNDSGPDVEPIFLAMHPYQKELLIKNSGSTIHSKDFVSRSGLFERGELPDVYGVTLVVSPRCPVTHAYAWQRSGVVFNRFEPMFKRLAEDPSTRFQAVAYLRQYIGACRRDDKKVVQVNLTGAAS